MLKYVIMIILSGSLVRLVHIHHVWNASKIVTERTFNIAFFKGSAIWYDETGIESLKKEEVRLKTTVQTRKHSLHQQILLNTLPS